MDIKIFKTKKSFKKRGYHINADLYWKIILYITFVFILLSFGFGLYIFTQINKESSFNIDQGSQAAVLDKGGIDNVLNYFSSRKEKSDFIINSTSPVVDPSI